MRFIDMKIACDIYVQSKAHQIIHFGLFTALVLRELALVSNSQCIA
jgi:hypothetical protein